jgi:2-amino-4-hydroxy-6-hydroxymethyldihydropteridine diphosphokinase
MMILLGIGANLPRPEGTSPLATCRAAVAALRVLPGYTVRAVSRWYETAPVPPSGQPPYVNGVARLEGPVEPGRLLTNLQAIEAGFGRVRTVANAARPLDLDIVAIGDLIRDRPDPVLPHPRTHLRAFVLLPLADVAPGWVHPVFGQTVEALLGRVTDQQIRLLASD